MSLTSSPGVPTGKLVPSERRRGRLDQDNPMLVKPLEARITLNARLEPA